MLDAVQVHSSAWPVFVINTPAQNARPARVTVSVCVRCKAVTLDLGLDNWQLTRRGNRAEFVLEKEGKCGGELKKRGAIQYRRQKGLSLRRDEKELESRHQKNQSSETAVHSHT